MMFWLLIALFVGQFADGISLLTIELTRPELLLHEQNGITSLLLGYGGAAFVLTAKMALVTLIVLLLAGRERISHIAVAVLALAALSGFIGAAFNIMALLS